MRKAYKFRDAMNNQVVQSLLAFLFAIFISSLILINRSPGFLRSLSMFIRSGFTFVLPVVLISVYVSFRITGWIGRFLAITTALALFSLALAGLWASGNTEAGLLNGIIPVFDAGLYSVDATRLLVGDEFSVKSSRRPLFSAFYAVLLAISNHNVFVALSILCILTAISCFFVAKEIQITHGAEVATLVFTILFIFYRFHSGSPRTESLGVALGALGFGVIWQGFRKMHQPRVWFGIFLTSTALIARAGAFFILPLIIFWGAYVFRPASQKISWRFPIVATGTVVAAFAINQLAIQSFSTKDTVPFGNFSYSLYGLASGGNSWAYVFEAHPEIESEVTDDMVVFRLAMDLIINEPTLLLRGMLKNWSIFLSNTGYGVYSFMAGETNVINLIVYWVLIFLCILGFIFWFLNKNDPFAGLIVASAIGIFISVPFLPPTDTYRVRAHAANIVVFGLLPSLGIYFVLQALTKNKFTKNFKRYFTQSNETSWETATIWFSVFLLFSVIIGPYFVHGIEEKPQLNQTNCPDSVVSAIVRYDTGTNIDLVDQEVVFLEWVPRFHIGTFKKNVHDFPDQAFIEWSENVKAGQSIFYGLDYQSNSRILVVIPTELLPDFPTIMEVCGSWESGESVSGYNIFYADRVATIHD